MTLGRAMMTRNLQSVWLKSCNVRSFMRLTTGVIAWSYFVSRSSRWGLVWHASSNKKSQTFFVQLICAFDVVISGSKTGQSQLETFLEIIWLDMFGHTIQLKNVVFPESRPGIEPRISGEAFNCFTTWTNGPERTFFATRRNWIKGNSDIPFSVTRYLFSIATLATIKICPISLKFAHLGSKFCRIQIKP